MNQHTFKLLAGTCRWTARVLGSLFVLVLLAIAIGEGVPNPFTQPLRVELGFLGLGLIMLGSLTGWRWDLAAGIVSVTGWCVFVLAVMLPKRPNAFVWALAVPAVLFLASALLRRHRDTPA